MLLLQVCFFWGFRDWNGFGDKLKPDEKKIKKNFIN